MQAGKNRGATGLALLGLLLVAVCAPVRAAQVGLAWDPPTDVNGAALPDLAGFRVCYGTQSRTYTATLDVGMNLTAYLRNLDPNTTYYIAVKAYALSGSESDASEEMVWAFDGDADGMPDSWEIDHFGDVSGEGAGWSEDYDGDGMPNGNEYVAGTNPADPDDYAAIRIVLKDGRPYASFAALQASGPGYSGMVRIYTLEERADLTAGAWAAVPGCEAIQATGGVVDVPVTATGASPSFYRTRIRLN